MKWRDRLLTNFFWRNAIADIWGRSEYGNTRGNFTPFFQYRIGPYQQDQYLYFSKEPYVVQYKNEIFNKLCGYTGYDIIKYLEFHYSAFPSSWDLLRFLDYELVERLKATNNKSRLAKLQAARDWVSEKTIDLKAQQKKDLGREIQREVRVGVESIVQTSATPSQPEIDKLVEIIARNLSGKIESLLDETEKGIRDITSSFVTGNIQLNNQNHKEKLIQLFIIIKDIHAPSKRMGGNGEPLFGKFANMDIASILFLHFDAFKDIKIGTVQTEVGKQAVAMNESSSANSGKLQEALQEFFYR